MSKSIAVFCKFLLWKFQRMDQTWWLFSGNVFYKKIVVDREPNSKTPVISYGVFQYGRLETTNGIPIFVILGHRNPNLGSRIGDMEQNC